MKGTVIKARIRYAEAKGPDVWPRVLQALPPDIRPVFDSPILVSSWYSFAVLTAVNIALDRMFGKGDLELCVEFGRHACDSNFTTLYRAFFRMMNINFLIRRAQQAWTVQFDAGEMSIVESSDTSAVCRLRQIPHPNKGQCLAFAGWVERACELTGNKNPTHTIEHCRLRGAEFCQWHFRWE